MTLAAAPRTRRRTVLVTALALAGAAGAALIVRRLTDDRAGDRPLEFTPAVPLAPGVLDESSGLAVTRREPHLLWSLNDSGNPAELVAVDTLGRLRGRVRVTGAVNTDWEDLTAGPCGTERCLFIGDIGDNGARRREIVIYRVPEPVSRDTAVTATPLRVRLEGGPRDIEALAADPAGDLWLISKGRGLQSPWLYRIPAAAWQDGRATAAREAILTALPLRASADYVTGTAIRPDGRLLALRSYGHLRLIPREADGRLRLDRMRECQVPATQELAEAVTWLPDGQLALSSERAFLRAPNLVRLRCPVP